MVPAVELRTYYDKAILKPVTWKWPIATYLFTGGMAGASATLAAVARLSGNDELARRALVTSSVALLVSPPLLISDLGRPTRFANMLRVVRPTSPMNMGSWLLAAISPAIVGAAASELAGIARPLGRTLEVVAGVLGPALATYTAVLLADTAVPVWHEANETLPFVFAAGAAMSAGAAAAITTRPSSASGARRLAIVGTFADLACTEIMRRRLGPLGEPYRRGRAKALSTAATIASAAGGLVMMSARQSRARSAVAGGLLLGSAMCQRFAIVAAGRDSADDPAFVVGPQRARLTGA